MRYLSFPIVCILLALAFFAGSQLLPKKVASKSPEPLVYDVPLRVLTKTVRPGDPFTTVTNRCQNTSHDLAIEATIFWFSQHGDLLPYRAMVNGQLMGPRFDGIIPPGCIKDQTVTRPFMQGYEGAPPAPGIWEFRGQICYGGVTVEVPTRCTSWRSEPFEVLP